MVLRGTHSEVRFPVPGNDQESDFGNATLQATADLADSIEFSVAMRVEVDPQTVVHPIGAPAVERVARALHDLFEWLAHEVAHTDGPIGAVTFEAEVGPFGDGEGYEEVPALSPAPRRFVVSVPPDRRATIRLLEHFEARRPGVHVAELPAPQGTQSDGPDAPDAAWTRHDDFTFEDWQREVAEGDTRLGYEDWVRHRREADR